MSIEIPKGKKIEPSQPVIIKKRPPEPIVTKSPNNPPPLQEPVPVKSSTQVNPRDLNKGENNRYNKPAKEEKPPETINIIRPIRDKEWDPPDRNKPNSYKSTPEAKPPNSIIRPVRDKDWENNRIDYLGNNKPNSRFQSTHEEKPSNSQYYKKGPGNSDNYSYDNKERDHYHKNYHQDHVSKFKDDNQNSRTDTPPKAHLAYNSNQSNPDVTPSNIISPPKIELPAESPKTTKDFTKKSNTEEKSKPQWRVREKSPSSDNNNEYKEKPPSTDIEPENKKRGGTSNPPKKPLYRTKASLVEMSHEDNE